MSSSEESSDQDEVVAPKNILSDSDVDSSDANEDEEEEQLKKKKKKITSPEPNQTNAASLFGEDVSFSDEDAEKMKQKVETDDDNDNEIVGPRLYSDPDEEEEREEIAAPTRIDLEMARCRANLGREGPLFVKFPNFLSVETKPFDPETYEDEIEDDDVLDEEGRTRIKLRIENTIRWRHKENAQGNQFRESNAKIVKWSDGTMSLYLGGEIFDVDKQKIMDHNHLFIRQGAGLQAQSVFAEKLIFRPHSTETLTHRKVTLNMADKSNKAQKVKVLGSVGNNPETQKQELIRKEEERLRAHARRESQQRRVRDRPRISGLSSDFLEGHYSDEGESLSTIKRNYQNSNRYYDQNYGDSSSEEEETFNEKRIDDSKIDSDDSEISETKSRHKQTPVKRKIIIDEDDD